MAIGAHPDDTEIGAAGMVAAAVASGHSVSFLILTDDAHRDQRRREAMSAATFLGVSRVVFAAFPDASLVANRDSVERLRRLVKVEELEPDLIVTHTVSDSHNDHVAANRLVHATFRRKVILHFPVHVSFEPDRFEPRLFVDVGINIHAKKQAALRMHLSQKARIEKESLSNMLLRWGVLAGVPMAEAFEVCTQQGCPQAVRDQVWELSTSQFHKLWVSRIGHHSLRLIYDSHGRPEAPGDWLGPDESIGRDALRKAFNERWLNRTPLYEEPSNQRPPGDLFSSGEHLLLVGGALSNVAVRETYNRLSAIRLVVDYELPRHTPAFVRDKITGARYDGDFGVFSIVPNPYDASRLIIFCGGTTGTVTRKILEALAIASAHDTVIERAIAHERFEFLVRLSEDGRMEIVDEF